MCFKPTTQPLEVSRTRKFFSENWLCAVSDRFALLWQQSALVFVWDLDGCVCLLVGGALSSRWREENVAEKKEFF